MINYFLLLISVFISGLKSVISKISNNYLDENNNIYTFNFYVFCFSFLMIFPFSLKSGFSHSPFITAMAAVYALFTILRQTTFIKACKHGDVALSSLFFFSGFLIPVTVSIFLYDEYINIRQITGIILLLISFAATVNFCTKINIKWILCTIAMFISSGMVGLLQKIFRMSAYKDSFNDFLTLSFIFMAIAMFFLMPKKKLIRPCGNFIKSAIFMGISLALANIINVYLSGILPSVIVFSFINGVGIITSSVLARIIIKEKISSKEKISIITGVIAILLIAA